MFNVSHEELQTVLRQLDQAIYSHDQWQRDMIRTLVCRLPHDHRDVEEDAHRQCRFGQWYYNYAPMELRGNSSFVALDVEHERVHQLAAQLFLISATESITVTAYDNFTNALNFLQMQLSTLKREIEDALFNRDPLTGAESRIGMLTKLRELHALVKRRVQSCCIAIMDLDHFKNINDSHGHLVGDQVLIGLTRYVIDHLRPYDKVFRYGGEEFLLCMPNTDLQTGNVVVERLREGIAATAFAHDKTEPLYTTVSFGITLLDPDVVVEESVDRADKAMYAAKAAGRNRSFAWDSSM